MIARVYASCRWATVQEGTKGEDLRYANFKGECIRGLGSALRIVNDWIYPFRAS